MKLKEKSRSCWPRSITIMPISLRSLSSGSIVTGAVSSCQTASRSILPRVPFWQGAAFRRRAHPRRTNKSLGMCSVDLLGPHDPTPRLGNYVQRNPCHYFLVLTVRSDLTADTCDAAVQATEENPVVVNQQMSLHLATWSLMNLMQHCCMWHCWVPRMKLRKRSRSY